MELSKAKKLLVLLVLGAMTVMLSGCVRLGIDLQVNKNKTVSGTMVFALADSLAALGGSSTSLTQGGLIDSKTPGVTTLPYSKDGFTGQEYVLKDVPISAFKPMGQDNSFSISETPTRITVSGYLDLSSTSGGDATSSLLASSILSTADIHVTIKFPYDVVSSTGVISSDRRTVTWHPKLGEKTKLEAVIAIPSGSIAIEIVGVVVVVLLAIAVGAFIGRQRKRKKQEAELEEQIRDFELNSENDADHAPNPDDRAE